MKHQIIQMIEESTGNYHYPVTLYEAIVDSVGTPLEEILRNKLEEFGLDYDKIVNEKIEQAEKDIREAIEEEDISEIREEIKLLNNRLSVKEMQIAYLASNWITGLIPIELTDIYKDTPRTAYIATLDNEPTEAQVNDYWILKDNYTEIRVKLTDGTWIAVPENTAIVLYGMTSSYAKTRGKFKIESGTTDPVSLGINMDRIGDIYIAIKDKVVPYMWLGTVWSPMNSSPSIETGAKTSIDALVDLVSCRYFTIGFGVSSSSVDYLFDGVDWSSDYPVSDSIATFLRSILPEDLSMYPSVTRRIYICPKKPTDATNGDAWISVRENRLYLNISTTPEPIWSLQINKDGDSTTDVKCTNLYAKSGEFDAFNDRQLWLDMRTGNYSTLSVVDYMNGFGVQELYGVNKSITQKVRLKPNTVYTYSIMVKRKSSSDEPVIGYYADGCEIHSTSTIQGYALTSDEYIKASMLFTTGPNVYESTCRLENVTGESILLYAPCLQEGFSDEWSPSLVDSRSGFSDVMNTKIQVATVYRETEEYGTLEDSDLSLLSNGSIIKSYERDSWVTIDKEEYEGLYSAIENLYSIYTAPGITRIYTQHSAPNSTALSVGDVWVDDNLDAYRFTGSSWGNINGVLASEQQTLSARLQVNNDVLMQSVFLESSIDAEDLFNIAKQLDPNISLYRQTTPPANPNTGDLWENTLTGITLRYNGVDWVATGSAQVSLVEQTVAGLNTAVSEVYDSGGGRNYIRHSISMEFSAHVQAVYTDLELNSKYVFSVTSSSATGVTQYTVRLMNSSHNLDYDNKIFTVGNTMNIWRFDTSDVPAGVLPHLVITYADEGSNLVLNKVQLEKGSLHTDWKAAIEDTEDSIASTNNNLTDLQEDVTEQISAVDAISQELINAINISNEALARAVTVSQRADTFTITASALTSSVDNMRVQLETYSSVFDFKPEGLQISSLVNGIKSDISTYYRSNGMYFWSESAGSDVGYVTADGLNIRNARVQLGGILAMGNFQWKPRSNGSLSLIYLEE